MANVGQKTILINNMNSNDINQIIANANANIQSQQCDDECQKQRKLKTLKADYDNAKEWISNGQEKYKNARDAYLTESLGAEGMRNSDIELCNKNLDTFISEKKKRY